MRINFYSALVAFTATNSIFSESFLLGAEAMTLMELPLMESELSSLAQTSGDNKPVSKPPGWILKPNGFWVKEEEVVPAK